MRYLFRGIGYLMAAILYAFGLLSPEASQAGEMPELSTVQDHPIPFGYKSTWFAVKTEDTAAVFKAMALTQMTTSNWKSGVNFSYSREYKENIVPVFVSPPVKGWTLVLTGLGFGADSSENISELETLLKHLSKLFGEAQYFGSYRVVDYVAWYRALDGKILRGFSMADGTLFSNSGKTTSAERDIGYFDMSGMNEGQIWDVLMKSEEESETYYFNEEDPMKIAARWNVNPLSFENIKNMNTGTGLAGFYKK